MADSCYDNVNGVVVSEDPASSVDGGPMPSCSDGQMYSVNPGAPVVSAYEGTTTDPAAAAAAAALYAGQYGGPAPAPTSSSPEEHEHSSTGEKVEEALDAGVAVADAAETGAELATHGLAGVTPGIGTVYHGGKALAKLARGEIGEALVEGVKAVPVVGTAVDVAELAVKVLGGVKQSCAGREGGEGSGPTPCVDM